MSKKENTVRWLEGIEVPQVLTRELLEEIITEVEGIEDNPVPSLNQMIAERVGAESAEYEQIMEILNGVETNKEQPTMCRQVMPSGTPGICNCTAPNCKVMQ